jgi:hypothetical protein
MCAVLWELPQVRRLRGRERESHIEDGGFAPIFGGRKVVSDSSCHLGFPAAQVHLLATGSSPLALLQIKYP